MRFLFSFLAIVLLCRDAFASLPSLNININDTSVSGLSAGAFFAVQMHVAYSSIMKGAGIFAGGPYHCAKGSEETALTTCMQGLPFSPSASALAELTTSRVKSGSIDDTANLASTNVFMFSGTDDTTVKQVVMNSLYDYYKNFIPAAQILYNNKMRAAHTQPTDNSKANACDVSKSPYVSDCNFDGAGVALNFIYGELNPRSNSTLTGQLIQFDQNAYFGGNAAKYSMGPSGYVYVPAACQSNAQCKLHVAFHGCQQNAETIGTQFITLTSYTQWAETNNLVILFPQTKKSYYAPTNPEGCFDWWGYNSGEQEVYDTQSGSQMKAIKTMIDQLTSGYHN